MAFYLVTGKLGNGKSLVSVARMRDYMFQHRKIATNLNIDLVAMFGKDAKRIEMLRVPDKPTVDDLNAIGRGDNGSENYDENKFGALVLDECGTWFNSRNWQDKSRKAVNDWFLHSRKLGWDVYLIIQDESILDSQARDALLELLVVCRRLDKLRVPFIGAWAKALFDYNLTLPRIHRAKVTYADGLLSDVWVYRGNDLFNTYDTRQVFLHDYPHGVYSVLPPWYTHGRYKLPLTWSRLMRLTKIYWKRFKSPLALSVGIFTGLILGLLFKAHEIEQNIVRFELQRHAQKTISPNNQKTEVNQSSAPSNKTAPDQSKDKTPVKTSDSKLAAFLDKLHITGSYSVNNSKVYQFTTGDETKYLTSYDVRGMGFAITPISDCLVELSMDDIKSAIRCI